MHGDHLESSERAPRAGSDSIDARGVGKDRQARDYPLIIYDDGDLDRKVLRLPCEQLDVCWGQLSDIRAPT